jgi:CheY-like chemotaxis protein
VSKRILLIDSDESFAQGLSNAIHARGFVASLATNSEQGMSMAKEENPDLIVICVEAQPTNGYMLCTRLKKDEALKGIPVILTSANATPDSFEKHKKLKTHAEEYLIKPFEPQLMLEKASALMGIELPEEQAQQEDEVIQLEDEPLGLGDLVDGEDEPISLSEADAHEALGGLAEEALVVEEVEELELQEEPAQGDDELDMFDRAFDSLGDPAMAAQPAGAQRFADAQPAGDAASAGGLHAHEMGAAADEPVIEILAHHDELDPSLPEDEARLQLEERVAELEQALAERDAGVGQATKGPASSSEVLKLKEAKNRADKEVLRLKQELNAKEKELVELQEQHTSLEGEAQELKEEAVKREAAARALQQRADALAAAAKKFERELTAVREEAKRSVRPDEADKLRHELENLRNDLNAAAGEKDLLSEEREELRKQLEEAQVTAVANEDRAVKAYQKIKNDEKLREKTRKALEIALQLLQENASEAEEATEAAKKFA